MVDDDGLKGKKHFTLITEQCDTAASNLIITGTFAQKPVDTAQLEQQRHRKIT